jgi:flap endonuclease-1
VDLAILIGTDFNKGVKGIGPKKALALVQTYERIENMPSDIPDTLGDVDDVRRIYLRPDVTSEYAIEFRPPEADGIVRFLCDERQFGRERVVAALDRAFRGPALF